MTKCGLDDTVWVDAGFQVFMSYGVSLGLAISLGSFNPNESNCYRDSIMICLINSATSLFSGFAVFAFIGFMAHETGLSVAEVTTTGPGLAFLVYPKGTSNVRNNPSATFIFMR